METEFISESQGRLRFAIIEAFSYRWRSLSLSLSLFLSLVPSASSPSRCAGMADARVVKFEQKKKKEGEEYLQSRERKTETLSLYSSELVLPRDLYDSLE